LHSRAGSVEGASLSHSITTKFQVGETGVGWDRGSAGQRGFEYVPDIEKKFILDIIFTEQAHYNAAS